jgi:hypothetical protein
MFPGCSVFKNSRGGTMVSLAYPLGDRGGEEWFYMGFLSPFRRIFLQRLLRETAPRATVALAEDFPMQTYMVKTDQGLLVAGINAVGDALPYAAFRLTNTSCRAVTILDDSGDWVPLDTGSIKQENHALLIKINREIPQWEGIFLLIK